jgi:hypothetical protein
VSIAADADHDEIEDWVAGGGDWNTSRAELL